MLNEVSHVPARSLEKLALLNEIGRLVISSTNLESAAMRGPSVVPRISQLP